jgi:hypothetical protein
MILSSWSLSLSSWKEDALRLTGGESFDGGRRGATTGWEEGVLLLEGEGEDRGEDFGWTRWGKVLKWLFCGRKARGDRSMAPRDRGRAQVAFVVGVSGL